MKLNDIKNIDDLNKILIVWEKRADKLHKAAKESEYLAYQLRAFQIWNKLTHRLSNVEAVFTDFYLKNKK